MALKRKQMKEEMSHQQEYQEYLKRTKKGHALSYYQWKDTQGLLTPDKEQTMKRKNTSAMRRIKEHDVGERSSLEEALSPEELKRLGYKK